MVKLRLHEVHTVGLRKYVLEASPDAVACLCMLTQYYEHMYELGGVTKEHEASSPYVLDADGEKSSIMLKITKGELTILKREARADEVAVADESILKLTRAQLETNHRRLGLSYEQALKSRDYEGKEVIKRERTIQELRAKIKELES